MLLLGVVQAQAAGVAGSYDLLATEILTGSVSSVTFSSLGDYAADYQHLQLRFVNRTTGGFADNMSMRINADTGSNYARHFMRGSGAAATSGNDTSQTFMTIGLQPDTGYSSVSQMFSAQILDILDYKNTNNDFVP
jgi:hypothetical protein